MSVVCAKVYEDRIEIASDSGVFLGDIALPLSPGMEKLFRVKHKGQDIIIGGVGTYSQGTLLQEYLDIYDEPVEPTIHGLIDFFSSFYQYSSSVRSADDSLKVDKENGDCFLAVIDGELFYICGLDIFRVENFIAIGAGQPYALTALACGKSAVEAVEHAIDLCVFVRAPVVHYEVKR